MSSASPIVESGGRIYAIALNTLREARRHRVIHGIAAAAVAVNLFAMFLGDMSLGNEARVAVDVGLAGVSFFGSITAIVIGVMLLYSELERRTIHTVASKPIARWELVVGKYLGMVLTLTLLLLLFTAAMLVLLWARDVALTSVLVRSLVLVWLEVIVMAGVALLFSSFSTPFLSGMMALAIFLIGRTTPDLTAAAERADVGLVRWVSEAALYIVPDLHLFSPSGRPVAGDEVLSIHGNFVSWAYVGSAAGYAALVIIAVVGLAAVILSRRDFS